MHGAARLTTHHDASGGAIRRRRLELGAEFPAPLL